MTYKKTDVSALEQHMNWLGTLPQKTAFIGHDFKKEDALLVKDFKDFFTSTGIELESWKSPETTYLTRKIKERIQSNELFIGIFTRRHKIENKEKWTTSDWVKDLKTYARAVGKPSILLAEVGVNLEVMEPDLEYIPFKRHRLHRAFIQVLHKMRRDMAPIFRTYF